MAVHPSRLPASRPFRSCLITAFKGRSHQREGKGQSELVTAGQEAVGEFRAKVWGRLESSSLCIYPHSREISNPVQRPAGTSGEFSLPLPSHREGKRAFFNSAPQH